MFTCPKSFIAAFLLSGSGVAALQIRMDDPPKLVRTLTSFVNEVALDRARDTLAAVDRARDTLTLERVVAALAENSSVKPNQKHPDRFNETVLEESCKVATLSRQHSRDSSECANEQEEKVHKVRPELVFLGGACNPTTWRQDTAMPMLDSMEISYYNPQVEDWSPDLMEIEAVAKAGAKFLLMVIGTKTRAIASMVEAAELVLSDRNVPLVITDELFKAGRRVGGVEQHKLEQTVCDRDHLGQVGNRIGCFAQHKMFRFSFRSIQTN